MTIAVQEILDRFDGLTEPEQREAARAILRRVPVEVKSTLSDEDLVFLADELFLELDHREAGS